MLMVMVMVKVKVKVKLKMFTFLHTDYRRYRHNRDLHRMESILNFLCTQLASVEFVFL